MNSGQRLGISAALGATAVIFGAFGAHALHERLVVAGLVDVWQTAVQYHLLHAVAFFAASAWASASGRARADSISRVMVWWLVGVILFSGSLYALALGAPRWIGAITPIGGLAFIVGWILVAFVKPESASTPK